jgi:hypothetical protein
MLAALRLDVDAYVHRRSSYPIGEGPQNTSGFGKFV